MEGNVWDIYFWRLGGYKLLLCYS